MRAVVVAGSMRGTERVEGLIVACVYDLVDLTLIRSRLLVIEVVYFHVVRVAQVLLAVHVSCVASCHGFLEG